MEKTSQGGRRSIHFRMFLLLPGEAEKPMDKKHLRQDLKMSKGELLQTQVNSLWRERSKWEELQRDRRELRQVLAAQTR